MFTCWCSVTAQSRAQSNIMYTVGDSSIILLPDLEYNQGCNCQNAECALTHSRMNEHE